MYRYSKKNKMAAMPMLAGVGLMMVCCSSSSVASMMMGGEETPDPDPAAGAGAEAGAGAGAAADPEGNMIDGYTGNHILDPGPDIKGTITECRKIAKDHGYVGVGHRNQEHPTTQYKGTCFFYHKVDSGFSGDSTQTGHKIGCTDSSKTWPNCGTPDNLAGMTGAHIIDPGDVDKSESLDKCRELAKSKGHKGTAFRTAFHPTDSYKKTCFYYSDTTSDFTGNSSDLAHVSACTDAAKTWPNC